MIRPLDYLAQAPCYWELADDGADFMCAECGKRSPAEQMIYTLAPNGSACVLHRDCTDDWWLSRATKMTGKL